MNELVCYEGKRTYKRLQAGLLRPCVNDEQAWKRKLYKTGRKLFLARHNMSFARINRPYGRTVWANGRIGLP
jgi:hypothetical protein